MNFRTIVWFWFFLFLVVGLVFWYRGMIFLDPDFGWHVRMGEEILARGVPRTDLFSYTMPSYPHVDHEWLVDAVIGVFYPVVGTVGLALADSVLVVLVLVVGVYPVISSTRKLKLMAFYQSGFGTVLLLGVATLLYYARVRYLVISWLFLAVLWNLLIEPQRWRRWRWLVPFGFILWANLHGGFVAGLATLVFVLVVRGLRTRKFSKFDSVVLVLSVMGTLINPYGLGLWREVWSSLSDQSLRFKIQEWQPVFFSIHYSLPIYLAFSLALVWGFRKAFKPEILLVYILYLLAGVSSQRHIPLWVVVSMPLGYKGVISLIPEAVRGRGAVVRLKKVLVVVILFSLGLFVFQTKVAFEHASDMSEASFYPMNAVLYLQGNMPAGEIFSRYGWGGYLLWKLPQKRVFVDGRMPSWRWGAPSELESDSAFDESSALVSGEVKFEEVFSKYAVDAVLWPVPSHDVSPSFFGRLELYLNQLLGEEESKILPFVERLENAGWVEVYQDSVAVIYQKKQ